MKVLEDDVPFQLGDFLCSMLIFQGIDSRPQNPSGMLTFFEKKWLR